ncbi:MAG: hypothetical protein OES09_13850 [Gammaproteobacteria bacterium]|nr:hypothetical protein [Gammaproteobacteria bacterium]
MNFTRRKLRVKVVTLTALVVLFFHPSLLAIAQPLILVLSSHKARPYELTLDAFKNHLSTQGLTVAYEQWFLDTNAGEVAKVLEQAKKLKPAMLFTLGSSATKTAQREMPNRPIVASLVINIDAKQSTRNTTGVLLQHSPETSLQWLKRLCPDCKRVGILYQSAASQDVVNGMKGIASRLGLELLAEKVADPKDLPTALNRLHKKADILWPFPDNIILVPQSAKAILLTSFRKRIPVIGPSSPWVKAGALYSLGWDYEELGQQGAELASELLRGRRVNELQPRLPRTVRYSLNLKTAKHMKRKFPADVEEGAIEVFK